MSEHRYDLGSPRDVDAERPTITQLQRAQAHALRAGDFRRASAYGLVVRHRLDAVQQAARDAA